MSLYPKLIPPSNNVELAIQKSEKPSISNPFMTEDNFEETVSAGEFVMVNTDAAIKFKKSDGTFVYIPVLVV